MFTCVILLQKETEKLKEEFERERQKFRAKIATLEKTNSTQQVLCGSPLMDAKCDVCWSIVSSFRMYGTCHKKLYEICRLSASIIRSYSTASSRLSAELSKGVRGFVEVHQHSHDCQRYPRSHTVFLE